MKDSLDLMAADDIHEDICMFVLGTSMSISYPHTNTDLVIDPASPRTSQAYASPNTNHGCPPCSNQDAIVTTIASHAHTSSCTLGTHLLQLKYLAQLGDPLPQQNKIHREPSSPLEPELLDPTLVFHRRGNGTYPVQPSTYPSTENSTAKSDHPNLRRLSVRFPSNLASSHQPNSFDTIPQSPSSRKTDESFRTERCCSP
nr:hypothetical protein CFP56_44887 [Quercus suber]